MYFNNYVCVKHTAGNDYINLFTIIKPTAVMEMQYEDLH